MMTSIQLAVHRQCLLLNAQPCCAQVELLVMCDMREPVAPEHVRRAGELLDIGVSPNAASVCTEVGRAASRSV